jgi:hypothetical protein
VVQAVTSNATASVTIVRRQEDIGRIRNGAIIGDANIVGQRARNTRRSL